MQILLMIVYVVLSVSGVVLVKLGSASPLSLSLSGGFQLSFGYTTLAGLLCYICSFLLYMSLIAKNDLSYIVPLGTGTVYILTILSSFFIFKEKLSGLHIVASLLILTGILLIAFKK